MLPLLTALAAAAQAPLPKQWAQFIRSGALSHITETVDIGTGDKVTATNFPYRLRFTRVTLRGEPEVR